MNCSCISLLLFLKMFWKFTLFENFWHISRKVYTFTRFLISTGLRLIYFRVYFLPRLKKWKILSRMSTLCGYHNTWWWREPALNLISISCTWSLWNHSTLQTFQRKCLRKHTETSRCVAMKSRLFDSSRSIASLHQYAYSPYCFPYNS